jgi:citrate lyase subunit beta/citryl-CoA lyase
MVNRVLDRLEALQAPAELALWCMIETPRGVLAAADIAAASERVAVLVLGTSDLTKDLHAYERRDRLPLLTALGLVLLAARAYRCAVLDGVQLDLTDHEGFKLACRQGRELGFDGKTLIHPQQIAPANAAFGPSQDELANARRLVTAYAEAVAAGKGAARIDGRLVEALHVEEAERILALAEAIGA